MRVVRAEVLGMCFGVRDALDVVAGIAAPEQVAIHGELVHNPSVQADLAARGFRLGDEARREAIPDAPDVLITAHGISDAERARLTAAGRRLIDTTCPLVARAHRAARALHDLGHFVVVIGRPGHVEVRGLVGDLERVAVVASAAEVGRFPADRLGIVCQTTAPARLVGEVRAAIEAANPGAEIRFVDTVCRPTKERQRALDRLLDRVEAVVVVGGRHSNNTRELVATCHARGRPAFHVEGAAELDRDWFRGLEVVGLTAGTSTLDATIAEVHRCLLQWS